MAAQAKALMKRGKRSIAKYLKEECSKQNREKHIQDLLDDLLDPQKALDDFDRIDWCRWLLSDCKTFEEFSKEVRRYDNAVACGLVWTANFVAYRCRTCGISPCMSLCADCFHAADHTGHDFNMFRSQAGGACDCGDIDVMRPEGFCPRHGPDESKKSMNVPPSLLVMAELMMPRLIFRLVQHQREFCRPDMMETFKMSMKDSEAYLTFLHDLSDMGAAMRRVITDVVTNKEIYARLNETITQIPEGSPSKSFHDQLQFNYLAALDSLQSPEIPLQFRSIPGLAVPLRHRTLLEELIFWTVKYEFPQKQVTLLLSLLPDPNYKEAFTRAFVQHYSRISIALVNSVDRQTISNRVVHISIQLLSPENLAINMVEEYNLLYVMLSSLHHMFNKILTLSDMNGLDTSFHMVVDCAKDALKEHCYWPIVSDLINILSHKPIAFKFMSDERLLTFWFELVSYFQVKIMQTNLKGYCIRHSNVEGMNLNHRELNNHIEYEPDTYYAAFSAELEICSSPMWLLLVHCVDEATQFYTKTVVNTVLLRLKQWFDSINVRPMSKPNSMQISFHLPLHRYLSVFVAQAVRCQNLSLTELLPSHETLQMLMIHPLQLQVVFHEIFCGMWVRNGLQIKGQALTYVQCHFCNSMVDADIYLLQVCATRLDPDFFVKCVLERFHVLETLTFAPAEKKMPSFLGPEHQMSMLEGALTLLCTLLSVRTNLGMSEEDLSRLEMLTLLCMNDRTHSQLTDLMPEKCGLTGQTKDFEPVLKQVADYKAPNFEAGGHMQQGMYMPKEEMWEKDFDPLYVLLRAMHRKDFQQAMDRFGTHVRNKGLYTGRRSPWPPFRLPPAPPDAYAGLTRLLHCRTLHGLLFTLLYKALNEPQTSEAVLYFCIYLLEMAVTTPTVKPPRECHIPSEARDQQFSEWFSSDDIFCNIGQVINYMAVMVREPVSTEMAVRSSTSSSSSDGLDSLMDEPDPDMFVLQPSTVSGSNSLMTAIVSPTMANLSGGTPATNTTPNSEGALVLAQQLDDDSEVMNVVETLLEEAMALPAPPTNNGNTTTTVAMVNKRSQGVTVMLDKKFVKQVVPIEESMLSLLVKLHAKLSGKSNSYVPMSLRKKQSDDKDSRIGDGPFFISKVLDVICRASEQCCQLVSDIYNKSLPRANDKKEMDRDERRRRAQERQKKLMDQFASKQKEFMEKVIGDDDLDDEDACSSADGHMRVEERLYDCVICNQSTPSTDAKPIGLVTLLQPTSVLGHRRSVTDPLVLPTSDMQPWQPVVNCATEMERKLKLLLRNFQGDSGLLSVNIGWKGGVHAQSCGHYVHLDCHSSYMKSLSQQQLSKGEYWCPLCRQLANTTLPIIPDEGPALNRPVAESDAALVRDIATLMLNRPIMQGAIGLSRAMGRVMESLTNITYPKYRTCTRSQSAENILVFVASIARVNLELELLQTQTTSPPPSASSAPRRSCFVPLLHVLGMHSKLLTTQKFNNLWSHVTGVPVDDDGTSDKLQPYQEHTPILLKDPVAVLLQLLLNLPYTMHRGEFQCVVRALFNVVYIQAIAVMTCKFSEEERDAWQNKAKEGNMQKTEWLLSRVVQLLRASALYNEGSPVDPHIPAICQSVWSPQSVEASLQDLCLPFLRIAALLQQHLFDMAYPAIENQDDPDCEYFTLCEFLGMTEGRTSPSDGRTMQSASVLHWYSAEPPLLLQAWCTHLIQFANKQPYGARTLLQFTSKWFGPNLIELPKQYENIFQFYRHKTCTTCNTVPRDPALCLMCGVLLCFKDSCCRQGTAYECVQHAIDCGGGTGIFLVVNSSVTVVIRGQRATLWGSVYLDEHGEEDRDLKRGKPLYLSEERYKLLQHQWLSHTFDHACKRWIFHQDRL